MMKKMKTHNLNTLSKRITLFVLMFALSYALLTAPVHAALVVYNTPAGNFAISYYNAAADYPDNCTLAEITAFGTILENLRTLYVTNYGLIAPPSSLDVDIEYQGINGHGWCNHMDFDPYWLGPRWLPLGPGGTDIAITPTATESTMVGAHELFHVVQCTSYGGTNPSWTAIKWVIEGQARMMQDKVYLDLDQNNVDHYNYYDECTYYLGNTHKSLTSEHSYSACLFWNYLTEQYGGNTAYFQNEPQLGVDIIAEFWNQANAVLRVDGIDTINAALNAFGHTARFEDVFRDFIVTNYAKDLTGTVPAEYQYVDETQPPGHYDYDNNAATPAVPLAEDRALGSSETYSSSDTIKTWAAKYYRIRPSTAAVAVNVQFTQTTNNILSYHMLLIEGGNLVQEYRLKARNFAKSVVNLDYDEIVLIVGGLENTVANPASYDYTFSTGTAADISLNIDSPLGTPAAARARVGSHLDPEKFLSLVEVLFDGSPVAGLEKTDFSVEVGTQTATIDTSGYVLGLYFLLMDAPDQEAAGLYDLQVGLEPVAVTGVEDLEADAVEYNGLAADNMLVIDKSGSMKWPPTTPPYSYAKISAAKLAGKLYVDSFLDVDKIGVTAFNETAWLLMNLQDITDPNRITAKNEIDNIEAEGWTSIGGGLLMAQNQLYTLGDTDHSWVILLLSDGQENEPPWVSNVLPSVLGNGTTVHTVAIGQDANQTLLSGLASDTGGTFHFAAEPASGDLPNDLADIYRYIAEDVGNQKRIFAFRGSGGFWNQSISVDREAQEAVFVYSFNASHPIDPKTCYLYDPNDQQVSPTFADCTSTPAGFMGYILWRVEKPEGGEWRIIGEGPSQNNYLIEAAIRHKLTMKLYFPRGEWARKAQTVIGEPVPMLVTLAQEGPVTGANVLAYITTPKYVEQPSETHEVTFYDDGEHGDGSADDGVYGNFYTRTSRSGTYIVNAVATGSTNSTGSFRREAKGAFYVLTDRDSDQDGMPDTWETQHGLDPNDPTGDNGAQGDPDHDGLSNIEEYYNGTDPMDSDTDGGGENDGSEVSAGRDPLNPEDDTITPPTTIFVVPGNLLNTVYFSLTQQYDSIVIYRSVHEAITYEAIAHIPPGQGVYTDNTTKNDQTYYYKVAATNKQGATSGLTPSASGTPGEDTQPPEGFLIINYGAETTYSQHVVLTLVASEDTVDMMVSNDPTFEGIEWEPYVTEKEWTLTETQGIQTVWALLRDRAGNEGGGSGLGSSAAYDSINLVQATIETCDSTGVRKDTFNLTDVVYVNGTGYLPSKTYDIYVVNDVTSWTDGMPIPTPVADTATTISSDLSGNIPPTAVWSVNLALGEYDIVVDVNGNGVYDEGVDALDNNDIEVAGIIVIPEFSTTAILLVALMLTTFALITGNKRLRKKLKPCQPTTSTFFLILQRLEENQL